MTRRSNFVTYVLVGMMCLSGPAAFSAEKVVSQSEMDQAVSKSIGQDDAARRTISTLLERSEARTLAEGYGLDLNRARAAVGALEGDELKRVSALAQGADSQLAGGAQNISISLVALLLIIIVVILIVK